MNARWISTNVYRYLAPSVVGLVTTFVVGCGQLSAPSDSSDGTTALATDRRHSATQGDQSIADELGHLRAVTARYQRIEAADSAGYSAQLTGCMIDPKLGGMGFHFGKPSTIDNTADPLEPEVLLYEPQENGRMRLVAVEYIIPFSVRPRTGPAPRLFGQDFIPNDAEGFKLWGLHAWVWRNNPAGMFADWNPLVNCDAVPAAARMSHPS